MSYQRQQNCRIKKRSPLVVLTQSSLTRTCPTAKLLYFPTKRSLLQESLTCLLTSFANVRGDGPPQACGAQYSISAVWSMSDVFLTRICVAASEPSVSSNMCPSACFTSPSRLVSNRRASFIIVESAFFGSNVIRYVNDLILLLPFPASILALMPAK